MPRKSWCPRRTWDSTCSPRFTVKDLQSKTYSPNNHPAMLASVTRLRVRSTLYLPAFLWEIFRTRRQVVRAPGFLGGRLLIDARRTFWTLTAWEGEREMKAFRGAGAHATVMHRLALWCDEASYAHWISEDLPSWEQAYEYLLREGRLSRVAHPSADQEARRFPRPRLNPLIGVDLKPRIKP